MTHTQIAPAETTLALPYSMGIQAMPGATGRTVPGSFHFMAVCEHFNIDTSDPKALAGACDHMVSYENHASLIAALESGEIDLAMIAVDNNNSGRVASAIEALRGKNLHIIGKIAIAVGQHLLLPPGKTEEDITQVASQKPALDQAEPGLNQSWKRLERPDTVGSAAEVAAAPDGKIDGMVTAAIASRMAGETTGLTVGRQVSPDGNATTFWIVTTKPENYPHISAEAPSHAAFTFSTADAAGSLLEVVRAFSQGGDGFNFTDIDCHLSPGDSEHPVFFAEVALTNPQDAARFRAISAQLAGRYALHELGIYSDRTDPALHTAITRHIDIDSAPIPTISWHGRNPVDGSTVVYVQSSGQTGSLEGMLTVFKEQDINLTTMTRPIAPDNNGKRGFGFVVPPDTSVDTAVAALKERGYLAHTYIYSDKELVPHILAET
jgi:prephenate dehydratase